MRNSKKVNFKNYYLNLKLKNHIPKLNYLHF